MMLNWSRTKPRTIIINWNNRLQACQRPVKILTKAETFIWIWCTLVEKWNFWNNTQKVTLFYSSLWCYQNALYIVNHSLVPLCSVHCHCGNKLDLLIFNFLIHRLVGCDIRMLHTNSGNKTVELWHDWFIALKTMWVGFKFASQICLYHSHPPS